MLLIILRFLFHCSFKFLWNFYVKKVTVATTFITLLLLLFNWTSDEEQLTSYIGSCSRRLLWSQKAAEYFHSCFIPSCVDLSPRALQVKILYKQSHICDRLPTCPSYKYHVVDYIHPLWSPRSWHLPLSTDHCFGYI